jgi:hypothetical protein
METSVENLMRAGKTVQLTEKKIEELIAAVEAENAKSTQEQVQDRWSCDAERRFFLEVELESRRYRRGPP